MAETKDVTRDITRVARDAAYVAVGLGVLGFQRAQVRRVELSKRITGPRKQIEDQLTEARAEVSRRAKQIDGQIGEMLGKVESTLAPLDRYIPVQARGATRVTRLRVRQAASFLRERARSAA